MNVLIVHGERFHACAQHREGGWQIEYLTEAGDCIDDSAKPWHPRVLEGENDVEAVRAIAIAYLAKLEKEMR